MSKTFKRGDDSEWKTAAARLRSKGEKKPVAKRKIRNYQLFAVVDEEGEYAFNQDKSWRSQVLDL
jgi:hypothetical protein